MDISEAERSLVNTQVALALKLRKTTVGATDAQIAERSGLSVRTVQRYLNDDREIGVGALVAIARALGTTARAILIAADQAIENNSR